MGSNECAAALCVRVCEGNPLAKKSFGDPSSYPFSLSSSWSWSSSPSLPPSLTPPTSTHPPRSHCFPRFIHVRLAPASLRHSVASAVTSPAPEASSALNVSLRLSSRESSPPPSSPQRPWTWLMNWQIQKEMLLHFFKYNEKNNKKQ